MAGKAALEAIRASYSLEHALIAAEAVARVVDRGSNEAKIAVATKHADKMAAKGHAWHAIVDKLGALDLTPQDPPAKQPATAKFVSAATSEAKKAGYCSTESLAAAEAVASQVFEMGGTPVESAMAGGRSEGARQRRLVPRCDTRRACCRDRLRRAPGHVYRGAPGHYADRARTALAGRDRARQRTLLFA